MKFRFLFTLLLFGFGNVYADSPPKILVLGDSLSSAYGLNVDQGWVNLLQKRLQQSGYPHQVINASISGDTTANGLARLDPVLDSHRPDIVIVELGGNDGLRAQSPVMIHDNLDSIIETIQARGAKVLLTGMRLPPNYGPAYVDRFERIYTQLASERGVELVPFFMDRVATVPELMQYDGVHPAAAAQPILLDNVWPHLQSVLQ